MKHNLKIGTPKELRKYEKTFPKEVISFCRNRSDLIFDDEANSKYYYTDLDFEKSVGVEVDDADAEPIRVEVQN